MKPGIFRVILLMIAVTSLIACQPIKKNPMNQQPLNEKTKDTIIQATEKDPRQNSMATKLSEFAVDLDLDGEEEKIELHTAAERNKNGEMVWDDGQKWLLVVQDGDLYYSLLDEYVQLGQVYFNVSYYDNEPLPTITVITDTGANFKLVNYVYDKAQKGYSAELVYDSKDINHIFTSIPSY
ncbi:hypothetical protein [Geosporobacter ferrireducens]|uniref:Lipoprotein n=1 Tax=Geosporobacter ferrireducens TaxID=1424294 RepID=A0A1D8GP30_9FIRM|nr:hypothetical protein [Geosporobacter ferrireducens]AOT72554.1 hypothetical protein Gferi_25165 [Geosporobacter ferrireducens]MTI54947.1 hypothetical protein [Geosporobacter ferrireducens]